jgi:hypothetical protein
MFALAGVDANQPPLGHYFFMGNFVNFQQFDRKSYAFLHFEKNTPPETVEKSAKWLQSQGATEISTFWLEDDRWARTNGIEVIIFWHPDREFYQQLWNNRPDFRVLGTFRAPEPISPLIEIQGDIWDCCGPPGGAICIPTNLMTKRNGEAIMGAGLAKQCADRIPEAPRLLGEALSKPGLVHAIGKWNNLDVLSFPTKRDWRDRSDIQLIAAAAQELKESNYKHFIIPEVGCGKDELNWERDVKPVLAKILANDDRCCIIS